MLMLGTQARWAVLPVQGRDQRMQLAVVDLSHPAVIRGDKLRTQGLLHGELHDVELGGVPCELLATVSAPGLFQRVSGLLAPAVLALQCGVSRASLQAAQAHVTRRRQGGASLLAWGEVRHILATMQEKLSVMQAVLQGALSGGVPLAGLSFSQLHTGKLACELTADAVQLMGGAGYRVSSPQGQRMMDARQLQALMGAAAWRRQGLLVPH